MPDTNSMSSAGASSFCDVPIRRTDGSPFQNHKELAKGTLRALMREAGLTVEEFAKLLISQIVSFTGIGLGCP